MKRIFNNLTYYLRLIWQNNKGYYVSFGLLVFAMIVGPVVNVLLPKILIRDILQGNNQIFFIDFLLLALASMSSSYLVSYYSIKNSDTFVGTGFRLKEAIQQKAMTMPFADTENPTVLNRIKSASASVDQFISAIHQTGSALLANGVILLFYLVMILKLYPVLLILPVLNIVVNLWLENKVKQFEFRLQDEKSEMERKRNYVFSLMYDYNFGKEIRLFTMKEWVLSIYRQYQQEFGQLLKRISKKKVWIAGADLFITFAREILVYVYLIIVFVDGKLAIDEFVLYTGIFASFSMVGQSLVQNVVNFVSSLRHVETYRSFVEETPNTNVGTIQLPKQESYSIEFENVSFRYPQSNTYVLKDFSCKIEAGKHVALVGINGAGKSTIIKLLCGLYQDYEGVIRIGGIDIRTLEQKNLQEKISAVFQESKLLPVTVLENITLKQKNTSEDISRAVEALKLMGLYDKIDALSKKLDTPVTRAIESDGVDFSGGERQNLVICRALYKGGNILLLDEPTAALDALAEHQVYEHFHMISQQRTTIFISHRLNSTRFCDEILLLEGGKIVERGTHEQLYGLGGKYYQLFCTQAKYYQEGEVANEK